jgi:hypothetical protein
VEAFSFGKTFQAVENCGASERLGGYERGGKEELVFDGSQGAFGKGFAMTL